MQTDSKITIVGIGGVGGYLSGMLCRTFSQVTLIARGERGKSIEKGGVILHSEYNGEIHAVPHRVVHSAEEIREIQDIIFLCVKNYSLEDVCRDLRHCVDAHTIIVPVMNGADTGKRTKAFLGKGRVSDCVIYITSFLNPDFSVTQLGQYARLVLGSREDAEAAREAGKYLAAAGIDCEVYEDADQAVWEKYIFNCAYNVETAYYNANVEDLQTDEKRREELRTLLGEACSVAAAKHIHIRENYQEEEYERFLHLSEGSTSSLKRDMEAGKTSEIETFGGYLVEEAQRLNIPIPLSEKIYRELRCREFLNGVKRKIEKKLEETRKEIEEGRQDIAGMHEYYWENRAEMDQYGYEDYDNQQALLRSVNANQEKQKQEHRYRKMLDSPFFGRVDFTYEGEERPESFYIGIGNFAERTGAVPLIYDWRAPVASLFYDFDQGKAYYDAPSGRLEGEIIYKWQYKIRGGKMIYAFESDMKIDDEILKEELGSNGDVKLKNIIRTIQREQNAIIRNTKDKILAIQGTAGSGKTSVALHRIAYLLYHDRKHLKSSNILILSPNSVFADYIAHILPELGEEAIQELNFDLFAYRELQDVVSDCEDRYDDIEKRMQKNVCQARHREKQSREFLGMAEGFLAELEERLVNLKAVSFRGIEKTEQEMIRLFYFKFQNVPLLSRADAIMEALIDEYETLYNRNISEEDLEEIRKKFSQMYVTKDLYVIYNWLMEESGYPLLPKVPYEKRKLEYEDVFPMLYLKYRLYGAKSQKTIRHLVIDEMQDYSYLQYVILDMLFACPMTILGDRAQTLDDKTRDVLTFLPQIFGKKIRRIEMKKSYRNTSEIAQYAAALYKEQNMDVEIFRRHGKPVEEKAFSTLLEAVREIRKNVKTGPDRYETAAVLTATQEEAEAVCRCLKEEGQEAFCIDRDSSTFRRGLSVTTFYLAKGLEFDQVFGIRPEKGNIFSAQADYITATRAMHELYMYRICEDGKEEE